MSRLKPRQYQSLYANFNSAVSRYDCGQYCAPHNGGEPVCCSTRHAVPIVTIEEWQYLKVNTDLWHLYQPVTAAERKIKEDLPSNCRAVECKGAAHCQRDFRSLSCRTFPFFPYITRERAFVGLATYWTFEDRCWVMSNLQIVEPEFVREFVAAYELIFEQTPDEFDVFRDYSASMRRVYSRRKRLISIIGRDLYYYHVEPGTGALTPADPASFPKHGVYALNNHASQQPEGYSPQTSLPYAPR